MIMSVKVDFTDQSSKLTIFGSSWKKTIEEKAIFYKVHPRTLEVQKSKSAIRFLKPFEIIRFEGRVLRKKIITAFLQ